MTCPPADHLPVLHAVEEGRNLRLSATNCGTTSAGPKAAIAGSPPRSRTSDRSRRPKTGDHGHDAGKGVNGRTRLILVDTPGLLLAVAVHSAAIRDRDGAGLVSEAIRGRFHCLRKIRADGGYAGALVEWVQSTFRARGLALDIVKRPDDVTGFMVLPRRWVVERTFTWLCRNRRLSKDYEEQTGSSVAMVKIVIIHLMARRIGQETGFLDSL